VARYYSNASEAQRFQPGTTVRADEVDEKFDSVASGFSSVEGEVDRSLKLVADGSNHEVSATASERRNKVVGFDANGDMTLLAGFRWRGDYSAGEDYFVNDVFREPTTKDLYVVTIRHTAPTNIDTTKTALAINVVDVEAAKAAAEAARDTAKDWANKTDGTVDGTLFSAKYWATRTEVTTLSADIQGANTIGTVATDIADVQTVAADLAVDNTIGTVAADINDVQVVSADISSVNTASADIAAILTVANDLNQTESGIQAVSASIENVDVVGADISNVNAAAQNIGSINQVATDLLSPNFSPDQIFDLGSVVDTDNGTGTADGYIITAVDNIGVYQTVNDNIDEVREVGQIGSAVATVANISADVTAVAGSTAEIGNVNANLNPITAVASITTNITNVAGISSDVTLVANNLSDISTVADDIVFIRSAPAAADNAASARDQAEAWADNAEDAEVESGRYSARHHAEKADAFRANAEQAKTDAESAEAQAQASRDAAAASENAAAASESAAAQSESNAAASESNAAQSAALAVQSLDTFDDTFLGAKSSDPSLNNDGDPIAIGALYYNTSTGALRLWNGSAWIDAINLSSALVGANNLSDLNSATEARGNLGLGSIATQNAAAIAITGGSITNTEIDLGAVS